MNLSTSGGTGQWSAVVRASTNAALLEQWEAIRQTVNCPTCDGEGFVFDSDEDGWTLPGTHCPDCDDGKIEMARLLAVGAAVFNASLECTWDEQGVLLGDTLHVQAHRLLEALRAVKP